MYACINMLIAPYFWHQTSIEVSENRMSFSHGTAGGIHIVQDDEGINIKGQTKSGTAYLTLKCKEVSEDKRPVTAPGLSMILTLLAFLLQHQEMQNRSHGSNENDASHHVTEHTFHITCAQVHSYHLILSVPSNNWTSTFPHATRYFITS